MAEIIPFFYSLGNANNFLVVGLCKMGFTNFVGQVTGKTADAESCVSSTSAPESMRSSPRIVKKVGCILL